MSIQTPSLMDNVLSPVEPPTESPKLRRVHILGPFNSGSSFAESLLRANGIAITDLAFQQMLFKHYPPALIAYLIDRCDVDCRDVLFVAVARDPDVWIEAMGRNSYELLFDDVAGPCRLDTAARNFYKSYQEHLSELGLSEPEIVGYFSFASVYDMWASSYRGYEKLGRRVSLTIVRYEDLLGDTVRSVIAIRDRLGLPQADTVTIPLRPAKEHGDARSYVDALDKLVRPARAPRVSPQAAAAVAEHLDPAIVAAVGYGPRRTGRRRTGQSRRPTGAPSGATTA